MAAGAQRWLVPDQRPTAPVRLFCFPHAGAGMFAYRGWPGLLPPGVQVVSVVPPGRDSRADEPPCRDVHSMVEQLMPVLRLMLDRPFAFFGHSLGALLAFETAAALLAAGAPMPVHLLVSGRRAPHAPAGQPAWHALPEAELVPRLAALGGMTEQMLRHPGWSAPLLRLLRADLAVDETYTPRPRPMRLPVPITAFGGDRDPRVPSTELAGWERHTSGDFRTSVLPGGHFYLSERLPELITQIDAQLRPWSGTA
jgi:medium-chain acyl-[acyl-carrier-protein] hydrolase